MDLEMKKMLKYSLSDDDIKAFFNNKVKIIKYSDLDGMTIDDLLNPYGRCVILFEIEEFNNGHWTILMKCNTLKEGLFILFFDSYGYEPENELRYQTKDFSRVSHQDRGLLLKILYNQNLPVHYNNYHLQKLKSGINTCGRWVCVRGIFPDLNEQDFATIMRSGESYDINPDILVCLIYLHLSHNGT